MTEKVFTCSTYLFDIFISNIPSTRTFKNQNFVYYTLRVIHEPPNKHTIDMIFRLIISFYSIFVEYNVYNRFNSVLSAPSISTAIFQLPTVPFFFLLVWPCTMEV